MGRAKIIAQRKKCWERRRLAWKTLQEVRKKNRATKQLLMKIKWAKIAAERARKNADRALKAKTDRLNATLRQQKIREQIKDRKRKNFQKKAKEMCARQENNKDDAEDIMKTAADVVK